MGRGSPLCAKRETIFSQLKNNVSQCKIAKNLGLSLSTVHNIVKRVRQYCLRNCHATMMDIGGTLENHCHSTQSTTPSRNATSKCIMQRGSHLRWTQDSENVFSDHTSQHFNLFFGKTGFYMPNMKKTIQTVTKSAKTRLCGMGVHQRPQHEWPAYMWRNHWYRGWNSGILERHMLPSKQQLFPGTPCLFQQDNARPHSAWVTTAWLHRHRVYELDWPACSPDLSPIGNVWCIMKRRIRQRRPRTVEQLKSCIHL